MQEDGATAGLGTGGCYWKWKSGRRGTLTQTTLGSAGLLLALPKDYAIVFITAEILTKADVSI